VPKKIRSANESPLVPVPTDSYIPERDLGQVPVLEARHIGIDFDGLRAVDDFTLTVEPNVRVPSLYSVLPPRPMACPPPVPSTVTMPPYI
jgi:hypothetical protein